MRRCCLYLLLSFVVLPLFAQDLDLIYYRFDYSMNPQLVKERIESIKRESEGEVVLLVGIADSLHLFDESNWNQAYGLVSEAPSSAEFNAYKELLMLSNVFDRYVALLDTTDEFGHWMATSQRGIKNLNIKCIVGDRYIEYGNIKQLWTKFIFINGLNTRSAEGGVTVSSELYPCGASYGSDEYAHRENLQYNKIYSMNIDSVLVVK